MKADYEKYPDLPPGCCFNVNKKTGDIQVYRVGKNRSPGCATRRESVGYIRNGVLKISERWKLSQELTKLDAENKALKSGVRKESIRQTKQATTVFSKLDEVVKSAEIDIRDETHTSVPMAVIAMGAILNALTGDSDCVSIGDFISRNHQFFERYLAECDFDSVSHDTVRRSLMLLEPESFERFYLQLLEPIVQKTLLRVIAADGQAVRASGRVKADKDGNERTSGTLMMMNVYDTENRVTLAQKIIDKKSNEISVGPGMLDGIKIDGCIVTADAMSCQVNFVESVLRRNAHYCISLKGNQDKTWDEVRYLFSTTNPGQIYTRKGDVELEHGRIERRDVSLIRGALLSEPILKKWTGLKDGAIVRVVSSRERKTTGVKSEEERFYITSIPAGFDTVDDVAQVIRSHWGVENNLHYVLDTHFGQDRIQSNNPTYLSNRIGLNKLALALLENYRLYLWNKGKTDKLIPLRLLQQRCRDPLEGIRCLGCALKWL